MDYAALAAAAAAQIADKGQPATLSRQVSLGYDPSQTMSVDAVALTFARSSGSWVTDGFAVGDSVTFSGFANAGNNAAFVVSGVSALVLTCATATGLFDEAGVYGVTAQAITSLACNVLEESVNSRAMFASSLMPGSIITEENRFFMLAGAAPKAGDTLTIGSTPYGVEGVRPESPGEVALYYTVRVKA